MKRFTLLLALLALASAAFAVHHRALQRYDAPNLTMYLYQRTFLTGKTVMLSLETYNVRQVTFAAYRVDLSEIVPNPAVIEAGNNRGNPDSVPARLEKMTLSPPSRRWSVSVKSPYPNQWMQQRVKAPMLAPGIYVLEARGNGVRKRTWLAVSDRALVVKRAPGEVQAWLVNATTGQPQTGVPIAFITKNGQAALVNTDLSGIASYAPAKELPLWVTAQGSAPAFAFTAVPVKEKPFQTFLYTDRPVYRPGQTVKFRGTLRAVKRGQFSLPAEKTVHVQIKTQGDTLLYDQQLPLNAWGSFSGDFALAAEPPLGHYTMEVILGDFRDYAGFEVEAYRKPEYDVTATIPARHYLGATTIPVTISAMYYFGSPVSGGKVNYLVNFQQSSEPVPTNIITAAGLGSSAIGRVEENFNGQGTLNKDGKLVVLIPTRKLTFDRTLNIHAEVTDLSLRKRTADATTLITAAQFRLTIGTEKYQYQPGNTVKVSVTTTDYDGKPVPNVKVPVTLIEHLLDRLKREYEKKTTQTTITDRDGNAYTNFKVIRTGTFEVESWAQDAAGNPVFAGTSFDVEKEKPPQQPTWPRLESSFDKEQYAPGDTAKLRVRTSFVGAWAWLTVEGEGIQHRQVLQLQAKEFFIKLPVMPEYKPGVNVYLTLVRAGNLITTEQYLNVPANDKHLTIILTPNKPVYQPGEQASYDVTVRDAHGRGAAAEVGLGVVDASLYAVRPDEVPDPFYVFWHPQAQRVVTDYSLAATYPGGGYQVVAHQNVMSTGVAAPRPAVSPDIRVRKNFADIAYWMPSLTTGPDGQGKMTFTMPDNLTTWTTTARAISRDTSAGQQKNNVKVTLPLLVRLSLPRFYVQHDEATAAAIVHNYTTTERTVHVTLSAEGAQVVDKPEQDVTIPADGITRLTWKIKLTGNADQSVPQQVRILVSADGGAGAQDAMESVLPLLPDGVKRVIGSAGMSADSTNVAMTLPRQALPGSAQMTISLSPSLAGPIFESLDYLTDYPYGCAEQTMDSFLPDIIVARTLNKLGTQREEPKMLQRYVNFGLQKLLRYQHGDGGWHWWENDQSDPYITAYVVYGLAMARDAGYPLAAGPLPRGVSYLRGYLQQGDYATRTYLLSALATANVWPDKSLQEAIGQSQEAYAHRKDLDIFSKASLALALYKLSKQSPKDALALTTQAASLANDLEANAQVSGTASHWTANAIGDGDWLDSDVEVTSQVLQALLAIKPNSEQIVPAVRWLMAARQGKAWYSSKDTASAVLALTTYLERSKELAPDETVVVKIGDRTLKTITLGKAQLFSDPQQITIAAADLQPGANTVRLEKTGTGSIYWSAHLSYVLPEGTPPLASGIKVMRSYRVAAENPVTANTQPSGAIIEVTTKIIAEQNYRYLMLEEPIPAGCETITGDAMDDNDYRRQFYEFNHRDVWDDRIVYYFDDLLKGEHSYTYYLRTEAPGDFRIRPNTAYLVYFPEVRGEGKFARLTVVEELPATTGP